MKIRTDIADMLRAGNSDTAIARRLHVDAKGVSAARTALGLPKAKSGRKPAATPEELFWRRTQAVDGGHLLWTGYLNNGGAEGACPVLRHDGRLLTAYRIAFRIRHGREPIGNVHTGCDYSGCVHPDHVEDRPMRERNRKAYAAIFGRSP